MITRWRTASWLLPAILLAAFTACNSRAQSSATSKAGKEGEPTAQKAPPSEVAGIPVNYDEAKVGTYTLPDPLKFPDGKLVRTVKDWEKRRPQIVRLFEENQYGRAPGRPADMSFDVFDKDTPALNGKAIRRQVTIYFSKDKSGPKMDLLVYVPAGAKKPVPLLLNASFFANATTVDDPGVKVGEVWNRDHKKIPANQDQNFANITRRIDVGRILDAGFGFATFYYGDVDPDFLGGLPYGVRALYLKPGQTQPAPDRVGSHCSLGLGNQPRGRLSGNRQGRRR